MKTYSTTQITVAAALTLLSAGSSFGAALSPVADTYVQNGSTANNSAGLSLLVKNQNNQLNDRVTFLRFDGSGLTEGDAISASLTLKITSFSTPTALTFQLFGIADGAANEAFDATTLTFANSGYTDQSVDNNVNDSLFAGAAPLATASILSTTPIGSEVTFSGAGLLNFLNDNNNAHLTFVVTTATIADSVFFAFGSSENSGNQPVLNVTVPEPTTGALLALGGIALALRRRLS
jgi:hypothetical protein